jgi:hypothetical protein
MGEEFYSAIKLVSGEEIFSLIYIDENEGDPVVVLQDPVIIKITNNQTGTYVKIKPWMEIPQDDIYVIKLDKIITMTEVKDSNTILLYQRYLNDDEETYESGKVKISDKMGYVSSVEDARKKLEDLYKDNSNKSN